MANEKRLIDAVALADEVFTITVYATGMRNSKTLLKEILEKYRNEVLRTICKAPTVDAVEVVRCKDCKHYKPQNQGAHRNCTTPYCMRVVAVKVSPDDFCSYGERTTITDQTMKALEAMDRKAHGGE